MPPDVLGARPASAPAAPDRAAASLAGLEESRSASLDLADPSSTDAFAGQCVQSGRPLHILVNNAGIANRDRVLDLRGDKPAFAANHPGHATAVSRTSSRWLAQPGG